MPTSVRALHVSLPAVLMLALAGLRPGQQPAQAPPAAAGGDGRQAGQAHDRRQGRICRPLRRGRRGRGARARLRLSRQGAFHRRPDGQAGRSPVHHRPPAVPERARPGARQPRPGARRTCTFTEGDLDARPAARARQAPSRSRCSSSAPRPSATPRPSVAAERSRRAPGRARSRVHRAARAGLRPYRRPPGFARQPGRPAERPAARTTTLLGDHRVDRSDPVRVHLRRGVVPALRAAWRRQGKDAATARGAATPVTLKLLDEQDFPHQGQMDFVDNVIDRASGTIRGRAVFANPRRPVHARHVRPRAGSGLAALRGAAGARRRDRHRAGAQVRAGGRCGQHRDVSATSRSARWSATCG